MRNGGTRLTIEQQDAQLVQEQIILELEEMLSGLSDNFLNNLPTVPPNATNVTVDMEKNTLSYDYWFKPEKPLEYISLNFEAVKTGVKFDEIIGEDYLD